MQSINNIFSQLLSRAITGGIGVLFLPTKLSNPGKGKKIKPPEDFMPVLRFAACSDIHLSGEEEQDAAIRFSQLFDICYDYAAASAYKGFDALVVAGDFSGGGDEKEYVMYNQIVRKKLREETKLLTVLGNHEFIKYRDTDATVGYDVYKKHISAEVDTHTVINGFHFIGVSYDDDGKSFTGKTQWLTEQLDAAVKDDSTKPVFVYQHPHPFATVYGSINWGDTDLRKVLQKYPQVIDFSGHSHYAPSDPRSLWQGSFTAVGCGSLAAFMGNLNYIEGDKDAPGKTGGFRIVEVDKRGNVLIKLYDIENRRFFDDCEYYISDIADKKKRSYTWHKQKALDTRVRFPENSRISAEKVADGINLIFPEAKGCYPAENYKITIRTNNKRVVWSKTVISGYVCADNKEVKVDIGGLEKGVYYIDVSAYSPYAKFGDKIDGRLIV